MITEPEFEDTYEDDEFKCPYCGEEQMDSWEFAKEGDSIEIECSCGKKYYGELVVSRTFKGKGDCELNKEEHNFVDKSKYFQCSKCGELKIK